ncbi:glycosyl hydrolase [Actinomadura sp. 6K520]|uniref:glycoside hydrolase family 26 protein n=1 Tax=Actinomadura sp. 6K520 TaxID=2530364 RepID=UPI001FB668FA|nr:glycosyl hydrolase [Actinomadura sp. 6K520]
MMVALTAATLATRPFIPAVQKAPKYVPLGAFLGSGEEGVARVGPFQRWLGSTVTVGRTYLPSNDWADIEGPPRMLGAWARWKAADPRRMLVVNVPMITPNEAGLPAPVVRSLLRGGAAGAFDGHYRTLAGRLASAGAGDSIIVLGWEMNGTTYNGICAPDPAAWKAYWRRIVTAMRAVPGARFRFDFAPTRGRDAIPWTECYPGDDVVDIIGSDSYDQPAGESFEDFVNEPYGLRAQAEFAAAHGKPISFPEWGLFRNSDNPEYIQGMHDWIMSHDVVYQSITDYCPHGVWTCGRNPRSSHVYRELFGGVKAPEPSPADPAAPTPWTWPATPPTVPPATPSGTPSAAPSPTAPVPRAPSRPPATARTSARASSGASPSPATSRVTAASSDSVRAMS